MRPSELVLLALCGVVLASCRTRPAPEASVIPQPVRLESHSGVFSLRPDTVIITESATGAVARQLAAALTPATGYPFELLEDISGRRNSIVLQLDASLQRLGQEGYSLEITPQQVRIRAPAPAGAFYATQTLRQLLPPAIYASHPQTHADWTLPCLAIEDQPRFAWRGALIDVARHFMPKETILKFIDLLAIHKMNSLQLHLTDDQGWRIEVKQYPKLTEIGSVRKETRLGHERDKGGFDGKPHGGFYSQDDIREMVEYARLRHIRLVPEIEMPGHAQAAIAAYPELGNTRQKLEVSTVWGVHKNVFNVSESTIVFLQNVLGEVLELFPSEFIHIGGDEVPTDQWKSSPQAQELMRKLGMKSEVELHGWFIRRMNEFLISRGRRLVGWDEILEGGAPTGAVVMSWRGNKGGIAAARAGHEVVMAPNTHTYFDYYQSKGPGEPLAIGGFIPLETVYGFDPIPPGLTREEARRILGAQAQLWTEYIATPEHLEYMAFPRLVALAEVAWTPQSQRDFPAFLNRLRRHLARLEELQVNFRPLEPR
jgi:hexosaminidase